jgi:hypothetical protein
MGEVRHIDKNNLVGSFPPLKRKQQIIKKTSMGLIMLLET